MFSGKELVMMGVMLWQRILDGRQVQHSVLIQDPKGPQNLVIPVIYFLLITYYVLQEELEKIIKTEHAKIDEDIGNLCFFILCTCDMVQSSNIDLYSLSDKSGRKVSGESTGETKGDKEGAGKL